MFFTPLKSTSEDALCSQLHKVLSADLKCSSTNETSIKLPILSERFSMSASSQYFAYLDSLGNVLDNFQEKFCKARNDVCKELATQLLTAAYVDVDYDTISRAVVLTAGWSDAEGHEGWSEKIQLPEKDSTVEIGVLNHEPNPDPEDVQFGGFLTVLGQDTAPSTYTISTNANIDILTRQQKQPVSKPQPATTRSSAPPPAQPHHPSSIP